MTVSSGRHGFCRACRHHNNEHGYRTCEAPTCRFQWKQCQIAGGCDERLGWKICKTCPIHNRWKPSGWEESDYHSNYYC
ncbi:hypothetical protein K440DRAFT_314516 [Wilcoxina mikolae CBS 423.85]|nr:hypothetical protein K440DRAFT_314516 [Wilcoxina mikolae CBS 423.85]